MTLFTQSGDSFFPTAERASMLEKLPTGNYFVVQPPMGPIHFQRTTSFAPSGRMYGDVHKNADRIMRTFLSRPRSTGVLLAGEKGSGKSQLARVVSELGYGKDIPTILINAPYTGDAFNGLLNSVEGPAIVLFDEFEKVYRDQEDQEAILTLLDGVMTSQKLCIFTVNDQFNVNRHMINRPGRLFYHFEFNGLDPEFVREYCADNLDDQSNTDGVLIVSAMFRAFNFDMLKAMVEEMNRYEETAFDVIKVLNTKPYNLATASTYVATVTTATGQVSHPVDLEEIPISGGMHHPRGDTIRFYAKFDGAPHLDDSADDAVVDATMEKWERELLGSATSSVDRDGEVYVTVEASGLRELDPEAGKYKFIANHGMTVSFERKKSEGPMYIPMSAL